MSQFVKTKMSCKHCGSSDAVALNHDGYKTCFSCGERWKAGQATTEPREVIVETKPISNETLALLAGTPPEPISDRRISESTVEKYKVACLGKDRRVYPYFDLEDMIRPAASKTRTPEKDFPSEGPIGSCGLFGEHVFPPGGKYLIITEGEDDAMAAYEMTGKPAVSVRNASSAKSDVKRRYDYIDSFDSIIVCCDMDEPGRKASKAIAEMLSDLWDLVREPIQKSTVMYPWPGLNDLLYGIRDAELVSVVSGSGMGKSAVMRELLFHLLNTTDVNIGGMFLEESVAKTGRELMSLAANRRLHIPGDVEPTEKELRAAFDATLGTNRVFFFDHFGSTGVENIIARARYLAKAFGCTKLFLDHVSIIVSSQENGDERKAIDQVMTKLRTLVQELNLTLFLVSHLKRPDGKGHEEGGMTSLAHIRGSAAIAQLSDAVIGLERNGQAESEVERNTTTVRVLKNRFAGETGVAAYLYYDRTTGRLIETDKPETQERAIIEEAL